MDWTRSAIHIDDGLVELLFAGSLSGLRLSLGIVNEVGQRELALFKRLALTGVKRAVAVGEHLLVG